MNAPAVKSACVKSTRVEATSVETATVKSTGVETATTVEAAAVTTATVTAAAAVTAATSRISQVGDRRCHNRGRKDRDKHQHVASFEHTTLHPFHGRQHRSN